MLRARLESYALIVVLIQFQFAPVSFADKINNQSTGLQAKNQIAQKAAQKKAPAKKFGSRLDELVSKPGAALPRGLKLGVPIYDRSKPSNTTAPTPQATQGFDKALSGYVTNTFPVNWKGSWSGNVSVTQFSGNPRCWFGDALETYSIYRINKVGRVGRITCNFKSTDGMRLTLDPPVIHMQMRMVRPSMAEILNTISNTTITDPSLSGPPPPSMISGDLRLPLGAAVATQNINGNPIAMNVLKNEIRDLDDNTLEQDVVVQIEEFNRLLSRLNQSYNETVLRFTGNGEQLDVEIAQVSYDTTGAFLSKTVYTGTLSRTSAELPDASASPFLLCKSDSLDKLKERAQEALDTTNFDAAADMFSQIISRSPDEKSKYLRLRGIAYLAGLKFDLAIADFNAAGIPLNPADEAEASPIPDDSDGSAPDWLRALVFYGMARKMGTEGNPQQALVLYDAALALRPNFAECMAAKAVVIDSFGQRLAAEDLAMEAVSLRPQSYDCWLDLAAICSKNGNINLAAGAIDCAINAMKDGSIPQLENYSQYQLALQIKGEIQAKQNKMLQNAPADPTGF